jgi:hypothetical protein
MQVEAIVAEGREHGVRVVGVPWETGSFAGWDGFYQTGSISSDRFRRTPVERLAHQLVHEAILAQLG